MAWRTCACCVTDVRHTSSTITALRFNLDLTKIYGLLLFRTFGVRLIGRYDMSISRIDNADSEITDDQIEEFERRKEGAEV